MLIKRAVHRVERMVMGRKAYKWILRDWLSLHDLSAAADVLGTMRFSHQIEPQLLDGPSAQDILVLAPHPDDEIIGPGGTLLAATRAGRSVSVLFMTSGKDGERDVREAEARTCCGACGFAPTFLGETAGNIRLSKAARAISDAISQVQPGVVFVPFLLDDHDDHRRVSEALMQTLSESASATRKKIEIWAYQVYTPLPGNVAVDITDLADEKASAIRTYESQMRSRDWAHFALGLNAFNCRFLPGGNKGPRYAECFFVVPAEEYTGLCARYFASGTAYYDAAYSDG